MSTARLAALLSGAAFLVRLLACQGTAIFGTDGGHYLLMADWMRAGRFHEALSLSHHPLYPLLVAAVGPALGSTEAAGNAVSVALGAAAVVPLFLTAASIFGRPAAFVVALLYAFGPAVVEVQSEVMTEGTFHFFLFSSLWLTWKGMEEPSLERGAVLGTCAAAAFLTRPEGVLAVVFALGWPLAELLRRRSDVAKRLGLLLCAAIAIVVLASPYLFWVKSVRGQWGLSVRPSAVSAERVLAGDEAPEEGAAGSKARLYGIYLQSAFRMTVLGLLIPFYAWGLASLRGVGWRKALFYFSWPLGLLGGVGLALRTHDFMSGRYLLAGMTLLHALAALGLVAALRFSARRGLSPALGAAVLLLLAVLPGSKAFRYRRQEYANCGAAAQWIRSQVPAPRGLGGPVEQVAYLAGCPAVYSARTAEDLDEEIRRGAVDGYVYSERDVEKRPAWVALLRSCDRLQAPRAFAGPPGTLTLYVQRIR